MDFLPRWKTTLGAIGMVLGGAAMVARALSAEEGVDWDLAMQGVSVVATGLGVFGIGKKIERNGKS